ncbi:MAG: hypothetical protein ACW98I_19260 [Candidatus Hodarchaeales archaeon]|jgi:hypothetical protein
MVKEILNLYPVIRALIAFIAAGTIAWVLIRGITVYKNNPRRQIIICYSLGLGLIAIGMFVFGFAPFLVEGQDFYAEIVIGGTLVVIQMGILPYIQYLHIISREVPVISKLFYLVSGANIMIILSSTELWKIYYIPGIGYYQEISASYSIVFSIYIILGFAILIDVLIRVRKVIDQELKMIESFSKEIQKNIQHPQPDLSHQARAFYSKDRLLNDRRSIKIITLFGVIGVFLLLIGFIFPGEMAYNADSLGVISIFLPQAYFYTKDKRLISLLQIQKVQYKAKQLHKSFSELDMDIPKEISEESVQTLIKFIKKADSLLYFQENPEY